MNTEFIGQEFTNKISLSLNGQLRSDKPIVLIKIKRCIIEFLRCNYKKLIHLIIDIMVISGIFSASFHDLLESILTPLLDFIPPLQ